jgi:hypothetical protein
LRLKNVVEQQTMLLKPQVNDNILMQYTAAATCSNNAIIKAGTRRMGNHTCAAAVNGVVECAQPYAPDIQVLPVSIAVQSSLVTHSPFYHSVGPKCSRKCVVLKMHVTLSHWAVHTVTE